jgi:hypothetical protein
LLPKRERVRQYPMPRYCLNSYVKRRKSRP